MVILSVNMHIIYVNVHTSVNIHNRLQRNLEESRAIQWRGEMNFRLYQLINQIFVDLMGAWTPTCRHLYVGT